MKFYRNINNARVLREGFAQGKTDTLFKRILCGNHGTHQQFIMRSRGNLHMEHCIIIYKLVDVMAEFNHFPIGIFQLGNILRGGAFGSVVCRFALQHITELQKVAQVRVFDSDAERRNINDIVDLVDKRAGFGTLNKAEYSQSGIGFAQGTSANSQHFADNVFIWQHIARGQLTGDNQFLKTLEQILRDIIFPQILPQRGNVFHKVIRFRHCKFPLFFYCRTKKHKDQKTLRAAKNLEGSALNHPQGASPLTRFQPHNMRLGSEFI